jgi:hypothetical protein
MFPDTEYAFFQWDSSLSHEVDLIVQALDTNHDGRVTDADAPAELNLVGYSWGGFNAHDVAERIAADPRFSSTRRGVTRLFTLDAYRTDYLLLARTEMRVSANVKAFYSFRHTKAPADECSRLIAGLVGPFTGRDPLCTGDTICRDHDFSAAPASEQVDHCDVPRYAQAFVIDLANGRLPGGLPPEKVVKRY